MTSIKISNQLSTTSTTISNTFIDHYMPPANGEFVKVYLYLIRMASCGQAPTIADMADALNNTESDITRALKYWEKQNILVLHCNSNDDIEFIELLPIKVADRNEEPQPSTLNVVPVRSRNLTNVSRDDNETITSMPSMMVSTQKPMADVVNIRPAKPEYKMSELQKAFSKTELDQIAYETETLIGKPLSSNDMSTLYYIYDQLEFPTELIEYLVEYCVDLGKKSLRYIEKVAIGWHEKGITSVEEARLESENYSSLNSAVMRSFGLTSWGKSASEHVHRWIEEYGMTEELIVEACDRTFLATGGKNSFKYAEKIIKEWSEKQVHTLEDLANVDAQHKSTQTSSSVTSKSSRSSFHNFEQEDDIDYDALFPKDASFLKKRKDN